MKTLAEPFACFDADGHLSEHALTALADGQDLLPEAADLHLGACEACTARFVEAAHASVETGVHLREAAAVLASLSVPAPAPASLSAGMRVASAPWRAAAAALVVAMLALSPLLARLPAVALRAAPALAHASPVLVRGFATVLLGRGRGAPVGGLAGTVGASVLLILVGVAVARWFRNEGVTS